MLARIKNKFGGVFNYMSAEIINLKLPERAKNNAHPLLSMFMVRRRDKFKVITNLAQLSPQELITALVRDAVWQEKEDAMKRMVDA